MSTYKKQFNIKSALTNKATDLLMEANAFNRSNVNNNYVSHLPEVYSGAPNRIERYNQYEAMDLDSHISASLDIIAEFCTQTDPVTKLPFVLNHTESPTESETKILNEMLRAWVNTNNFDNYLFDIIRDVLKYGDQFFIRDPETFQWLRIYHGNVEKVIVNESKGKKPEQYVIKDLDLNLQNLSVSQIPNTTQGGLPSIPGMAQNTINYNTRNATTGQNKSRFGDGMGGTAVLASHVVHLNMTRQGEPNWPFGSSILEKVFKSYKQKELIEDAILIYRIQRAPQRRIFYVDVGDLPESKAMAFVEQVKNSVSQRRIPSKSGGGSSMLDASYNPISILDDFFFPQKPDGRGSKIDTLPGGETSWGIDELQYFDNKLARGLRIPSSYLPTGPDDSPATYNDGKVGTALIQEVRFSEYCKRIQRNVGRIFDQEFKLYLKQRDIAIDAASFSLGFVEPQSFVTWRQIEIDTSSISNFNAVATHSFISKRFALTRYLGWSEDEINKNHTMLIEENPKKFEDVEGVSGMLNNKMPVDLRDVGFSKGMLDTEGNPEGEEGIEGETPETGEPSATTGNEPPTTPETES